MPEEKRRYKDYRVYKCIALNRLVAALGIDLSQTGLEEKAEDILASAEYRVSKEDIKHEIRSNHYMATKVLEELTGEGYVFVEKDERGYSVRLTKAGLLYIRETNRFFASIFRPELLDHYRYREIPRWLEP